MTTASFHIIDDSAPDALWLYCCQLCEQWVNDGQKAWLWCPDETVANHLDDLLWGFREDAFVPHSLDLDDEAPITLGVDEPPAGFDHLINLSGQVPADPIRFTQIIELVDHSEPERAAARERWKIYRQAGIEVLHKPVSKVSRD